MLKLQVMVGFAHQALWLIMVHGVDHIYYNSLLVLLKYLHVIPVEQHLFFLFLSFFWWWGRRGRR